MGTEHAKLGFVESYFRLKFRLELSVAITADVHEDDDDITGDSDVDTGGLHEIEHEYEAEYDYVGGFIEHEFDNDVDDEAEFGNDVDEAAVGNDNDLNDVNASSNAQIQ